MIDVKKIFCIIIIPAFTFTMLQSCGKKEEPQTFIPPEEQTVDKEKEKKEREEFERLKNLRDGITDSALAAADSLSSLSDTTKSSSDQKTDKKKFVQKERELNKRLDNPKTAISDYLEFLKRGTSEGGNFELNMKKASQQWESSNLNRFKTNYKNTEKIIILEEPKIISQSGNNAVVEVTIKKIDKKNNKDEEIVMAVKYNLIADSKGKWKIKNNIVVQK